MDPGAGCAAWPHPGSTTTLTSVRNGNVLVVAVWEGACGFGRAARRDAQGWNPATQLIDVRSGDEWRAGHVAGALNVPVTQLGARIAALRLDGTRPIVAMCRSGGRSKVAVRLLQRHGFGNACELQGGMRAWQQGRAAS